MKQQIEIFMNDKRITIMQGEVLYVKQHLHSWPSISRSTMLPNVLLAPIEGNSISMVRALKQIKGLLEIANFPNDGVYDVEASIDDIETMLVAIK